MKHPSLNRFRIPISVINALLVTVLLTVPSHTRGQTVSPDVGPGHDVIGGPLEPRQGFGAAWGDNISGSLGDGTTTNRLTPVAVSGLTNAIAISGAFHSLALRADGTVVAWGDNRFGQLGNDTTIDMHVPKLVGISPDVVSISAGSIHSAAVKSDGTVWTWGDNTSGQLGNGTVERKLLPTQVPGLTDVVEVSAGGFHTLALKADGTVWAWGHNSHGELGNGTTADSLVPVQVVDVEGLAFSGVVAISAGGLHSLALKADGTVWAWGLNFNGELGIGTIGTTDTNSSVPVKVQRRVDAVLVDLTNMVAIAGGVHHSVAIRSDGTAWAWGKNFNGELGNGTTTDSPFAVQVTGLTGVVAVAAGSTHSLAATSDGTAWAWGFNGSGRLGDGTTEKRSVPVQVSGLTEVITVAAGSFHSLAITAVQPPAANTAPIAVNDSYNTARKTTLTVGAPGVLGNDTDPEGRPLTAVLVRGPEHAESFSLDAKGGFTYNPGPVFTGTDTFTYRASDGELQSDIATVTITVTPANATPVLNLVNQTGTEGVLLTFQVTATDADGDSLIFSASNLPPGATFDPATQKFSWTPNFAQGGANPYFVDFTVNDGFATVVKTISITIADVVATVDSDGDGVPDNLDNCPDNANSSQLDVCHDSPEPVTGAATATVAQGGSTTGALSLTVSITVTTGATATSFVVPDLFTGTVFCEVINNATRAKVPFERIPETGFVVMNSDSGDLVTVPAGTTRTIPGRAYNVRLTHPSLKEGSYTFACLYRNRVPLPEPDDTDPSVWVGDQPVTTTTAFVGAYTFSGFLPPLPTTRDVRGSVPVKFSLKDKTGAFISTCTCSLMIQRLNDAGSPVGAPFPATPTGGSRSNLFRSGGNQYIYNLNTHVLDNGRYRLIARLDNGTEQTVDIRVRQ
jgi:alpha-tubulin suppressor-like RCC1 family protein